MCQNNINRGDMLNSSEFPRNLPKEDHQYPVYDPNITVTHPTKVIEPKRPIHRENAQKTLKDSKDAKQIKYMAESLGKVADSVVTVAGIIVVAVVVDMLNGGSGKAGLMTFAIAALGTDDSYQNLTSKELMVAKVKELTSGWFLAKMFKPIRDFIARQPITKDPVIVKLEKEFLFAMGLAFASGKTSGIMARKIGKYVGDYITNAITP
jgi:hypothetical protein